MRYVVEIQEEDTTLRGNWVSNRLKLTPAFVKAISIKR
jgi:hypothetical protein